MFLKFYLWFLNNEEIYNFKRSKLNVFVVSNKNIFLGGKYEFFVTYCAV